MLCSALLCSATGIRNYILQEVGPGIPMQSRSRDKTYPKIGTSDSYPAFEVGLQVVPVMRHTLKLISYCYIHSYLNFLHGYSYHYKKLNLEGRLRVSYRAVTLTFFT